MKWSRVALAVLAALSAATAYAHSNAKPGTAKDEDTTRGTMISAETAFEDGDYLLAARIAESKNTTAALAFAARARIADAITRADGVCLECLIPAEATAHAAIAAAAESSPSKSDLAQAYVQLAIAIGFHGRLLGTFQAQSEGLAEKGKAAVDRALELDPTNPWALASLGGWHLEIVHRAGSLLASTLYGANEEDGLKSFRAALAAEPGSLLLHYHYALSILALDFDRFRNEALIALHDGYKDPRTDAVTRFTRGRTDLLTAALMNLDKRAIRAMVAYYQGYPVKRTN